MTLRLMLPLLLALATLAHAGSEIKINQWLIAGPLSIPTPLFADSVFKPESTLEQVEINSRLPWPSSGEKFEWSSNESINWEERSNDSLQFKIGGPMPYNLFAVSCVETDRQQEIKLSVRSGKPVAAWFDGKSVGKQTTQTDKRYELSGTLDAHTGRHLLVLKFASEASLSPTDWGFHAILKSDSAFSGSFSVSTNPRRTPADFADWGLFQELTSPVISADGKYVAVVRAKRDAKFKKDSWIEIYSTLTAALVTTLRPASAPGNLFFMAQSPELAYSQSSDDGKRIVSYNIGTGVSRELLPPVKALDRVVCSADEKYLYYSADDEKPENKSGYSLFDEIEDRDTEINRERRLFEHCIASGVTHALSGLSRHYLVNFELSPIGDKLAFVCYVPRVGRPYRDTELWVYDLKSRSGEKILSLQLTEPIENLCWLPGEKAILYTANSYPSLASDTVFHNVNHHCVYQVTLRDKSIKNLTSNERFSPSEMSSTPKIAVAGNGKVYFSAVLEGDIPLYEGAPGSTTFQRVNLSLPVVEPVAVSRSSSMICYIAQAMDKPAALYCYNAATKRETQLLDPNRELLNRLDLARAEDWEFVNSNGDTIDGWVHLPKDFDSAKKYPLVVYYYGGVTPRDERFTFSYHWWCANGYVVYVLNPRGCVGYGQEFADWHSNDWGTAATEDVIEGTKKILAAKSYLDPERIGAYGGSYGGFITLDLATKTDMFTALVDMYGISNIANYFGAGTWGYWYGDLAAPGSLPWSHKDIFVDKSPIFSADKIKTPLLIMHGASDPNVPPNESDQMFTALKLLGRDVAYVKFVDETHNINVKFENLIAHREMMLEWFDKYLKGQPKGWETRWKNEK